MTNYYGELSQHAEFTSSGEIFIDERLGRGTDYLFLGYEWDAMTGFYHLGNAHYLDPRLELIFGENRL